MPCFSFFWIFCSFQFLFIHDTILPVHRVCPGKLEFFLLLMLSLDLRSLSSMVGPLENSIGTWLIFGLWFYLQECKKLSVEHKLPATGDSFYTHRLRPVQLPLLPGSKLLLWACSLKNFGVCPCLFIPGGECGIHWLVFVIGHVFLKKMMLWNTPNKPFLGCGKHSPTLTFLNDSILQIL